MRTVCRRRGGFAVQRPEGPGPSARCRLQRAGEYHASRHFERLAAGGRRQGEGPSSAGSYAAANGADGIAPGAAAGRRRIGPPAPTGPDVCRPFKARTTGDGKGWGPCSGRRAVARLRLAFARPTHFLHMMTGITGSSVVAAYRAGALARVCRPPGEGWTTSAGLDYCGVPAGRRVHLVPCRPRRTPGSVRRADVI